VGVLKFAHLASFVGNPTSKRPEAATAHTGGRYAQLPNSIINDKYLHFLTFL
jgi:hypothetical protein